MNIPNTLTGIRFVLIGFFVYFFFNGNIPGHRLWSFVIFIAAGITDLLDGYIARRCNMVTKWGKLMDPLADKLMLITVLACLCIEGYVPLFIIVIVALKELLMILGAAFLYKNRHTVVQANYYGKVATVLFYLAITAIVFNIPYARPILAVAVLSTILAFAQYTKQHFSSK